MFFQRQIVCGLIPGLFCLQHCPSIKVIVLHKDAVDASVDGSEVVDESLLFLHRTGEMMLVLHGWSRESKGESKEKACRRETRTQTHTDLQLLFHT